MIGRNIHKTILVFALLIASFGYAQNNIENLEVVIEFNSVPSNAVITHVPLKYNKDFALSFTMDDGNKGTYSHAFKFLQGGIIDGNSYNPLYYTDGCDNDIKFTMSAAIYSFSGWDNRDIHDPSGDGTDEYITWPEIIEMYQNGCGIFNHGLTTASSGDINYLIAKNHSYIKSKTQEATPGGIHPIIFVAPNGVAEFTEPAFKQGYNAVYRTIEYGVDFLNVNDPAITNFEIGRQELNSSNSVADLADKLYNAANSQPNVTPWSSTFTHSIQGEWGGYSFSMFKTYFGYLANTYGKGGMDNMWFTSEEEVLDYVLVRNAVTINQRIEGNNLYLTFTGDVPDNLRNYAITLVASGDTGNNISSVTISGDSHSSYNIDQNEALININWEGRDIPSNLEMATYYVDSTERTQSQNVADIAIDYINILPDSEDKTFLKDRLCSVSGINLPTEFCEGCFVNLGDDISICEGECTNLSVSEALSYLWSTGETTQNITICPTQTTQYHVKITDINGCEARDTILVSVNPQLNINKSNDTTICANQCIKLWASGGTTYLWSTGETTPNIEVCPENTTTYYITVSDQHNCSNIDSIKITVNEIPTFTISEDKTICPNSSTKLGISDSENVLWSTGETSDTIQVFPSENTKYFVTVTNDLGCSKTDSISVFLYPKTIADAGENQVIEIGECTTLVASGGTTFEWETGETENTIAVCPNESRWYSVKIGNEYNCYSTDSVYINLKSPQQIDLETKSIKSIVVMFNSNPSFVNVNKAPLKYNKEFALSFHIKNGSKDIYTHAFPYLNGGTIDGTNYPGITFTDGCDNQVSFKMGVSLYAFTADGSTDIHDPEGDFTDDYISWPEIIELYNANWGIFNQGVLPDNSGDKYYSVARNQSFVKFKTYESVDGGIPFTVLMNPDGDIGFSSTAFDQGYRAAFANYAAGIQYYDISTIPNADSLKMGINSMDAPSSLGALADLMHNNYNPNTRLWASANISSITDGNTIGYDFSVLKFYIDYIEAKYGSGGLDNIWFTHEEEVWDYLTTYNLTTISEELLDNRLLITFNGNLPSNMNYSALSLLLESDADIESITITGGKNNSYKVVADTSALINLNWGGIEVIADSVLAEQYVVIAETNKTTNDALIAMDYVNMLSYGSKKEELRNRLCAINGVTLPSGYCQCEFFIGNDTLICKDDCIDLIAPEGTRYLWNTEETSQSIEVCPEDTTAYWVKVFNEYDCHYTDTIVVNLTPDNFADAGLDTTICAQSCIDLVATGGVEYLWSTGETNDTINVCPTEDTKYFVTATNAVGCTSTDSVTVSLNTLPEVVLTDDVNLCFSDTATLIVRGGTEYLWSTGSTNDTIKVSPANTTKYYVWVYNEYDCAVLDSVMVNVIPLPTAEAGKDFTICIGQCVTLTASGGSYYQWDTQETTQSIEVCPLDTTTYRVTVYDEYGCFSSDSVKIFTKDVPEVKTSKDTIVCPGTCVKIWANGGSSYEWSTGETTDTIKVCPDEAIKYYVEVFNNLGCSTLDSVLVETYTTSNPNAGEDEDICPGESVELTATGGYAYLWNTGAQTNKIEVSPNITTDYIVVVYDEHNCPASDTVRVNLRIPPSIVTSNDTSKCISDCVTLSVDGALIYLWSTGSSSSSIEVCPDEETKYYVTGTDQYGCSTTDSVTVSINPYENVSLSGLLPSYCDNASAILLEGSPANGNFGGNGVNGNVFSPSSLEAGEHQVYYSVVDNSGCAIGDTIDVQIYETPTVNLGDDITLCSDETYEIFVNEGYDQYLWSNGNTSGRYLNVNFATFGLGATLVELTVTDNGCVAKDDVLITYENCVGIEEFEEIGISIFPNPSNGIFSITYDGTEKNQSFSIYNLQGQELYTEILNECSNQKCTKNLDVSYLTKGIYIIRFYNKKGVRSGKILIQ